MRDVLVRRMSLSSRTISASLPHPSQTATEGTEPMIEVRLRHDYDDKARHLCEWPATDLDRLIPEIGGWGVIGDGEYETADLFGQIVLSATAAYFEIVVSTESD